MKPNKVTRQAAWAIWLGLTVLLSGASPVYANLLAYEDFNYPPGSQLLGCAGALGFSGSWFASGYNAPIHDNYFLSSGSLPSAPLLTSANCARTYSQTAIAGLARTLANPIPAGAATTRYFSLLMRPEGVLDAGAWNGFFGLYLDGAGDNDLFIGKPGNTLHKYVIEGRGGSGSVYTNADVVLGQTALFVLKAEFNASSADRFTLFVNPDPRAGEPTSGTVRTMGDIGAVNSLVLYSTGAFSIDEIRVGTTYADVLPVPEPSAIALLGVGAVGLVIRLCRRRSRPARSPSD